MNNFKICKPIILFISLLFLLNLSSGCSRKSSTGGKVSGKIKSDKKSGRKEEMIIKVFFLNGSQLAFEERTIQFDKGKPSKKINKALIELIEGPVGSFSPTIPEKTKLLNTFIDDEGIVYLDFSKNIITNHPGGTFAELATIYSIVYTLTKNFEEVSAVQILVDGNEINSLAGHIDISKPIKLRNFTETSLRE